MSKILNVLLSIVIISATLFFLKRKFIVPKVDRSELTFTIYNSNEFVDLSQGNDKVIVVNFWQTWCGPCLQEMPSLNEMNQKWSDIQVYCVSDEAAQKVAAFQNSYPNITFLHTKSISKFGVTQFPTTYIYNKQGTKVFSKIGGKDWANANFIATLKKNWEN